MIRVMNLCVNHIRVQQRQESFERSFDSKEEHAFHISKEAHEDVLSCWGVQSLSVKSDPWGALSLNSKMMLLMLGRAQSIDSPVFLKGKHVVNTPQKKGFMHIFQ